MARKASAFTGIILIAIGSLFLLRNLGLLDFSMLYEAASFWPAGLILAGAVIVYGRKDIGFVLIALTIVFAFMHGVGNIGSMIPENTFWIPGINCVSGSGNITTIEREGIDFSELEASSGVVVHYTQGTKEPIRIEAEDNLIELVKIRESGDALKVSLTQCIRSENPVTLYVSSNTISKLDAISAAKIIGENEITVDNIEISAHSAGSVDVELDAKTVVVESSSAGKISLEGTADTLEADANSVGYVYAFELRADEVVASANSAALAQVYAIDKLDAEASSAGKVQYKGTPTIINIDENSGGDVTKS